jgi:GAF domain-containing protein/anti-sigma regulatory factor (Ser/Thr protein kinase)
MSRATRKIAHDRDELSAYERQRRHVEDLGKALSIAEDLTSAMTEPERILQTTIERTVDLFGVTRGAILLYEGENVKLVASCGVDSGEQLTEADLSLAGSGLGRSVRAATRPIVLPDIETASLLSPDERAGYLEQGIRSSMLLPLVARGRSLGVIRLDVSGVGREFTATEQELAQILADLAAVAIDNARIYGVAERDLDAILAVVQSLMARALQPDVRLDDLFSFVMDRTLDLLDFDTGWLLLREGNQIRVAATDRTHVGALGQVFPIDDCVSGLSMLKGEAIYIDDLDHMEAEYRRVYKVPLGGSGLKSELVVPLMVGQDPIGAFNIESEKKGAFGARHIEMLKLLSGHVALAIELAQSRQRTAALSSVSLDIARATDMDEVVRSVLHHALELVRGQFGQVLLREGDDLAVTWTTNDPPTDLRDRVSVRHSISGLSVMERRPVIVPDVTKPDYLVVKLGGDTCGLDYQLLRKSTEDRRYVQHLQTDKAAMQAELAVPLESDGVIVGVLNIETPRKAGISERQRSAVCAFAPEFAEALWPPINRDRLCRLLQRALALGETEFGQVLRLDGSELVIEQTTGGEQVGTRVQVGGSVTGRAVRQGTVQYVSDVAADPEYLRYLGEEMKSELAVPILVGEEVVGVLNVESPVPGFFVPSHARILEAFAAYAGVAIDRARRFEGQKLAEIGELAGDIVHSLNNPLGAIGMRLELLKRKPLYAEWQKENPYMARFVERTERDLDAARSIIWKLRTELRGAVPGPTLLRPAVRAALVRADLPDDIEVEIQLPEEPIQVLANDRLINVFWNLFDNARKAMPAGGKLSVVARTIQDRWVDIRVTDTGVGIEPWRLETIFSPDESTTTDPYAPAHGLGLWWTQSHVERFGGEISAESEVGVGTCITLKLRQAE